jgi:hypothetical protein
MEVQPEVSSLSSTNVQISTDLTSPVFNSRKANTIVTVQDGHTIIIGGLITTTNDHREEKVPILGDIPLLGLLFRDTKLIKQRTELLIILTPRIVRSVEGADQVTNDELSRLNVTRKANQCLPLDSLFNPLKPTGMEEPTPMGEVAPTDDPASTQPAEELPPRRSNGSVFFPKELQGAAQKGDGGGVKAGPVRGGGAG